MDSGVLPRVCLFFPIRQSSIRLKAIHQRGPLFRGAGHNRFRRCKLVPMSCIQCVAIDYLIYSSTIRLLQPMMPLMILLTGGGMAEETTTRADAIGKPEATQASFLISQPA